jgi:hypothetical protein
MIEIEEYWAFLTSDWTWNGRTLTGFCDSVGKVVWITRNSLDKVTLLIHSDPKPILLGHFDTVEQCLGPLYVWLNTKKRSKSPEACIARYAERYREVVGSWDDYFRRKALGTFSLTDRGVEFGWVRGAAGEDIEKKPLPIEEFARWMIQ